MVANRLIVDANSSQTMLRVGRWIVYADYKQVWAATARWRASFARLAAYAAAKDLTGTPRLLGKAYFFAPSAAPGARGCSTRVPASRCRRIRSARGMFDRPVRRAASTSRWPRSTGRPAEGHAPVAIHCQMSAARGGELHGS